MPMNAPILRFIFILSSFFLVQLNALAQPVIDDEEEDSLYMDSTVIFPKRAIVIPPFELINPDTLNLGEHDELVCDSYTALGCLMSMMPCIHLMREGWINSGVTSM